MMKIILIYIAFMLCFIQCESKIDSSNSIQSKQNKKAKKEPSSIPQVLKTPVDEKDKKMDKEALAKRIEPIDENVGRIIADSKSQMRRVNTPFLKEGEIYIVSKLSPTRRIEIFVGLIGNDYTEIIGGDEEKYFKFINKSKLKLSSTKLRLEYILNFLEITKSGSKRFQILESIEELKERPNLDDTQKQEFESFQEKYKNIIKPPKQGMSEAYKIYLIIGQDLVEYEVKITEENKIEKTETILEKDLLITYSI